MKYTFQKKKRIMGFYVFLYMYFKSNFFSYTFRYRIRMFIIETLIVHTSEDKYKKVSLSQFSTLPVTLKLVLCMTTTRGQHCSAHPRHRLNQISHIVSWYCSPFLLQHLAELIESEVEVVAGAHVYPADPICVQWDSSAAIWKAMEAH
jgi:hypothetical protein